MADENTPNANTPAPEAVATPAPDANAPNPADAAAAEAGNPAPNPAPASELITPPSVEVEAIPSEAAEDGTITYNPTGDAALDVALTFLGGLGIGGEDPALVAAANGQFALLEAKLATMGDKAAGWPQMLALAKDAYQRSKTAAEAQVKQVDAAILSVVQSADNWAAIKSWAAQNASPEEKAAINAMIDAGPVQARAAATLLLGKFREATGTVINPATAVRNASGENPAAGNLKLNARDYNLAVADLHRKLGSRMESSEEYAALRRRLAA